MNNIKVGVTYEHTILTERDTLRPGGSDRKRALSECQRKSRYRALR